MKPLLEKSGTLGAIVSAAASPVCFPKLALVGAMLGLGVLGDIAIVSGLQRIFVMQAAQQQPF